MVNTPITICNWGTYQATETPGLKDDVKAPLNECYGRVGPVLTNKNVKNEKNIKNYSQRDSLSFDDIKGRPFDINDEQSLSAWLAEA